MKLIRGIQTPPEAMMHFPSVSDFPLFPNFFFDFHLKNFPRPWFSHWLKFFNFPPIFAVSVHFPPFRENHYFPPTFSHSPDFAKVAWFFTHFLWFSFPPSFTMMHLRITQCTYWTPLKLVTNIKAWNVCISQSYCWMQHTKKELRINRLTLKQSYLFHFHPH